MGGKGRTSRDPNYPLKSVGPTMGSCACGPYRRTAEESTVPCGEPATSTAQGEGIGDGGGAQHRPKANRTRRIEEETPEYDDVRSRARESQPGDTCGSFSRALWGGPPALATCSFPATRGTVPREHQD